MNTQQTQIVNGVNITQLFETIDSIKENGEIAKFNFRAQNKWKGGTVNQTTVSDYSGACQTFTRSKPHVFIKDEPPVLQVDRLRDALLVGVSDPEPVLVLETVRAPRQCISERDDGFGGAAAAIDHRVQLAALAHVQENVGARGVAPGCELGGVPNELPGTVRIELQDIRLDLRNRDADRSAAFEGTELVHRQGDRIYADLLDH